MGGEGQIFGDEIKGQLDVRRPSEDRDSGGLLGRDGDEEMELMIMVITFDADDSLFLEMSIS